MAVTILPDQALRPDLGRAAAAHGDVLMASSVQELPSFTHTYTDEYGNVFDESEYTRIFWASNPVAEYNKMLRERLESQTPEPAVFDHAEAGPVL